MAVNETPGLLTSAAQWYQSPSQGYFPGQTVAMPNSYQQQGHESMIGAGQQMAGYVEPMMNLGMGGMEQYQNYLGQAGQINPYLEEMGNAYTSAAARGLRELTPSMNSNAIAAGQMGGNRHALAQGLTTGRAAETLQEQLANLYGNQYSAAANRELQAYGMMPGMMNAMGNMGQTAAGMSLMPGQAMVNAGNMYQGNAQQQLNSAQERWNWEREQPYQQLSQYASLLASAPNMGQAPTPQLQNSGMSALMGAGAGMQANELLGIE